MLKVYAFPNQKADLNYIWPFYFWLKTIYLWLFNTSKGLIRKMDTDFLAGPVAIEQGAMASN